tara:strand:+ start:361 stop:864 length:504 start_codon:yes stop_codon:yes gene_type:complete
MEGIGIYIISSGRPNNVQKMQTQHLPDLDVTWVVSKSQIDAYKSEGANKVLTYGKCAPGKDLSRSRNFALQHTFDQNLVCVQLSDDLNKMSWWVRDAPDSLERRPLSIATAIQFILKQMKLANFFLGGGMPTNNTYVRTGLAQFLSLLVVNSEISRDLPCSDLHAHI